METTTTTAARYIRFDALNVGALLADISGSPRWVVTDITSQDGEYRITTRALHEDGEGEYQEPMIGSRNAETKGWNA